MADSAALLFVSIYIFLVVFSGKADELLKELKNEKGFAIWITALLIVYWLWRSKPLGDIVSQLSGIALLALFLFNYTRIEDAMKNIVSVK